MPEIQGITTPKIGVFAAKRRGFKKTQIGPAGLNDAAAAEHELNRLYSKSKAVYCPDSEVLRIASQRPRPEAPRSVLEERSSMRRSGRRLLEHPSRRETSPRSGRGSELT